MKPPSNGPIPERCDMGRLKSLHWIAFHMPKPYVRSRMWNHKPADWEGKVSIERVASVAEEVV